MGVLFCIVVGVVAVVFIDIIRDTQADRQERWKFPRSLVQDPICYDVQAYLLECYNRS